VSIRLRDIRIPAGFAGAQGPLFDGLNLEVGDGAHVGVLGGPKSGKTTLLRLVCGSKTAEEGVVERGSRTSWPIPLSAVLLPHLSPAQNIRMIARLYGVRDESFPRRIAQMMDFLDFLNRPLQKCPQFVKPRLALALGIGLEFDTYLFDGSFAPADKSFREKATEIVAGRMAGRGYVLATASPPEVERNCDSVYVLEAGQATHFADAKEGTSYFKELLAAEKQKQEAAEEKEAKDGSEEDGEGEGPGDVDVVASAIADEIE
jgi:capsular polysaccharide transport system ATP-binding protein